MRRTILNDHNNGKALEIRLEQEGGKYYVILAGMAFNLHTGNVATSFNGNHPDGYLEIDNDTYRSISFDTYSGAKTTYDQFKTEFID